MNHFQNISFTQSSFDERAKQLIEAIRLNKDAYHNNIVILANVWENKHFYFHFHCLMDSPQFICEIP